jgi:hypothetical protein
MAVISFITFGPGVNVATKRFSSLPTVWANKLECFAFAAQTNVFMGGEEAI